MQVVAILLCTKVPTPIRPILTLKWFFLVMIKL